LWYPITLTTRTLTDFGWRVIGILGDDISNTDNRQIRDSHSKLLFVRLFSGVLIIVFISGNIKSFITIQFHAIGLFPRRQELHKLPISITTKTVFCLIIDVGLWFALRSPPARGKGAFLVGWWVFVGRFYLGFSDTLAARTLTGFGYRVCGLSGFLGDDNIIGFSDTLAARTLTGFGYRVYETSVHYSLFTNN